MPNARSFQPLKYEDVPFSSLVCTVQWIVFGFRLLVGQKKLIKDVT